MVELILPFGVKQDVLSVVIPVTLKDVFSFKIVAEVVAVHPLLLVTVTVYVPDERLLISSVDEPFDQEKT